MPKTVAIYRILYGEDFIEQSIRSVLDAVDEVRIYHTNKPWGNVKGVKYKGEFIKWPEKFDNVLDVIRGIDSPKIKLEEFYHPVPHNQFTILANRLANGTNVIFIEADQVMREWPTKLGKTYQIEHWKSDYKIPQRNRPGPIFEQTPLPATLANGTYYGQRWNDGLADNYGFCISDQSMYWKHLTAIAFSHVIGDSRPRQDWYDEVWMKWTPAMRNLEIARGRESDIPYAR